MEDNFNTRDVVIIEPTYPHSMMMHINKLVNGNKNVLRDKDVFLLKYTSTYSDANNELRLLNLAYDKNIVAAFFECDKREQWRKRVLIEKSLRLLVSCVAEKYAVMIIESIMFVFDWQFRIEIDRRWKPEEEDKALFHEKTSIERSTQNDIIGQIQIIENNNQLQLSEFAEEPGAASRRRRPAAIDGAGGIDDEPDISVQDYGYTGEAGKRRERPQRKKADTAESTPVKSEIVKEPEEDIETIFDLSKEKMEEAKFYNKMSLKSRRVLKKAFQGNAASQCETGDYYAEKESDHLDYKEAAKWYSLSARKGYERASFELGKLYDQNPSEIAGAKDKAVKIYTEMAEKGLPTAQCILGMKYWFGDGVEVDYKKAAGWLKKAAAQKHDAAIRNLGDLYAAISDSENAYRWYKIGAAPGDDYCRKKMRAF